MVIYGYLWLYTLTIYKNVEFVKQSIVFLRKVHKTQMCNSPFSIHARQTTITLNDVRWRVCKHYYPSFDCSAYQHRYDSRGPPYPTFPYSDMQSTLFWGGVTHAYTNLWIDSKITDFRSCSIANSTRSCDISLSYCQCLLSGASTVTETSPPQLINYTPTRAATCPSVLLY